MGIATVTFRRCVQNAESDEQHITSRIYFDLELEGQRHTDICLDIRQPVGKAAPLEISRPHGYTGPGDFDELREAAATYYRKVAVNLSSAEMPVSNSIIVQDESVSFEV